MSKLSIEEKLEEIARKHLGITTLDERHMDDLDFHDVSIWSIKNALTAAYAVGYYQMKHENGIYPQK